MSLRLENLSVRGIMRGILTAQYLGDVGHHGLCVFGIEPSVAINHVGCASMRGMPVVALESRPPPHREELYPWRVHYGHDLDFLRQGLHDLGRKRLELGGHAEEKRGVIKCRGVGRPQRISVR
jgi:hypothetical protein